MTETATATIVPMPKKLVLRSTVERLQGHEITYYTDVEYRQRLIKLLSATSASVNADMIANGIWTRTPAGANIHDFWDTVTIVSSGTEQDAEAVIAAARIAVFKHWRWPAADGAGDLTEALKGILSRLGWPSGDILVSNSSRIARNWLVRHSPVWSYDGIKDDETYATACRFIHAALPYPSSPADMTLADLLRQVAIEDFGTE